jgi:hypothetical protein
LATPKFSMSSEFIKNTPYKARSEEDKILFLSKMPWHLEYRTTDKAAIDALLSYMYNSGRMEHVLGGAAFHHKNSPDADFNQRNVNATILTWHIAMIRSMSRVSLRGLMDLVRPVILQQFNAEETKKVEMEVSKLVCDIMMTECKAARSRVWCLIIHNWKNEWVGYYKMGVRNDSHKEFAIRWAGSLSPHLRYFLLQCRIDDTVVTKLIKKSFDYNAVIDAVHTVEQNGRVISKAQAATEQKIADFDQKNTWGDLSLGHTPAQQLRYEQSVVAQAMSGGQFNYNEESLVNLVSNRNGNTVFTTTRDVSLGPTMYEVVDNNDLVDSKADKVFFMTGFDDDKEENGAGNTHLQMEVVHQDKLRTLGAPRATGPIVVSQDSSRDDEDRQQAAIAPRSVLR